MRGAAHAATRAAAALAAASVLAAAPVAAGPEWTALPSRELDAYFRAETARLAANCLTDVRTLEDWNARRDVYRQELLEMLGLSPPPPRGDLKAVVTGQVSAEGVRVENLRFESIPGLHVTANLYLPAPSGAPGAGAAGGSAPQRAPAVLYLCGHGPVIEDGVSFGNKVAYQHHGAWLARHGYVTLLIDTLQLGEIQGLHHGTYRENRWWWNSRGYTPAGVEAWNATRAIDYLVQRPEVDPERIGVTGRSGGGAYSWWVAAIDDRVKAVAPVAGITDLENHVVDGCVEGHCDCMYFVNTYRWDFAQVAALVAPRPLLVVNTDDDGIFPLDGVHRIYDRVRRIYDLHDARSRLGLAIGPGPHRDTQDLQVPVLRWFDKHLRGEERLVEDAARKLFTPRQLKVLDAPPPGALNASIDATFVARASPPPVPSAAAEWAELRSRWTEALRRKVFAGWPSEPPSLDLAPVASATRDGLVLSTFDFTSQEHVRLRLYGLRSEHVDRPTSLTLDVIGPAAPAEGAEPWRTWLVTAAASFAPELREELEAEAAAGKPIAPSPPALDALRRRLDDGRGLDLLFAPRGLGRDAWRASPAKLIHVRRRFQLLGQTLDGMRAWDIRRAIAAVRSIDELRTIPLVVKASGDLASSALYASLFEPPVARLELTNLPLSHTNGPDYLNVLRFLDVPQALALAAERAPVVLRASGDSAWDYPRRVAAAQGWPSSRIQVEATPSR